MRYRYLLALPAAVLVWAALSLGSPTDLLARQPSSMLTSTSQQREEIAISVYQQNLGLVSEVRTLRLQPGLNQVRFLDVAEAIDPSSVYIQFLTHSKQIKLREQDFIYDLLTPKSLLRKFIGQPVELHEKVEGQVKEKITPAVLLSVGEPNIYQIGDQLHLGHPGRVVINKPSVELVTKPTLIWQLEAGLALQPRCQISYLTQGLSWTADYLAIVAADEVSLSLEGWVSIDNRSGASYENATLKLIAGQIHRYPSPVRPLARARGAMLEQAKRASPLQERPLFEYHQYTLAGQTNLADKHTKQIRLMGATNISAEKSYIVEKQTSFIQHRRVNPDEKIAVRTILEFVNKREHNLGIPLPQGRVRVFKADAEHRLQLIGEDRLEHTPEGEKIRLELGEASNIVGERVQTDYKKLRDRAYQAEYQVKLRNHKPTPVKVTVVEHPSGDWQIIKSSVPFKKRDVRTAEAVVEIPPQGEKSITYTIRVEH